MLEAAGIYPPLGSGVDTKAVFDAIKGTDVCDPAKPSLQLHILSVRDRIAQGTIRYLVLGWHYGCVSGRT